MLRAESHVHTSPENFPVSGGCPTTTVVWAPAATAQPTNARTTTNMTALFMALPLRWLSSTNRIRVVTALQEKCQPEVCGNTQVGVRVGKASSSPMQELQGSQ